MLHTHSSPSARFRAPSRAARRRCPRERVRSASVINGALPRIAIALVAVAFVLVIGPAAETGHDLWLRYPLIEDAQLRSAYRLSASSIVAPSTSPTGRIIASELQRGLNGLIGGAVRLSPAVDADGAVVVGTPATVPAIAGLGLSKPLEQAGRDGYLIRSARADRRAVTVIASQSEVGALHGAFHFLRLIQTRQPIAPVDITERPRVELRLLNHWDNLNGSIERGYAGQSLWKWRNCRT